MRWDTPRLDQVRIIKKFLLTPRCMGYEAKWLEWGYIVQTCKKDYPYGLCWSDTRWTDKESYELYKAGELDLVIHS